MAAAKSSTGSRAYGSCCARMRASCETQQSQTLGCLLPSGSLLHRLLPSLALITVYVRLRKVRRLMSLVTLYILRRYMHVWLLITLLSSVLLVSQRGSQTGCSNVSHLGAAMIKVHDNYSVRIPNYKVRIK
jgi:hypothetical protein